MGLLTELNQWLKEKYVYTLPDGKKVHMQPIDAATAILGIGVSIGRLQRLFEQREDLEDLDPEAAKVGARMNEAFWVHGIIDVDGEKVRLCFSDDPKPDHVTVSTFKAFLADKYGPDVVRELEKKLMGAGEVINPEEVKQNPESFREETSTPTPDREDVRGPTDRTPTP